MPSNRESSRHFLSHHLRKTAVQLASLLLEAGSRSIPLPGGRILESLEALGVAADVLERSQDRFDPGEEEQTLLLAVATALAWCEDAIQAAGLSWPSGALSVRPEQRSWIHAGQAV
jgi:hypothetical protein